MKKRFGAPTMICEARAAKAGHIWIIELLIFVLVFTVGSAFESIPASAASVIWVLRDDEIIARASEIMLGGDAAGFGEYLRMITESIPSWVMLVTLFSTVLMTLTVILYCRWIEKRRLPTLGFRRKNALREYLVGIAAGFASLSAAVGIGLLTGAYTITATAFSPGLLLLFLLGYILQGMSEEVMCRGYLMVSMARKSPAWLAAVLSSLVFAVLHLANPGITVLAFINLFLCGLVFAVFVLRRGSIWGACAMHSFWNFFQGNFYGFRVSGSAESANASVLSVTARDSAGLWSGGSFGIEGGLGVTIVLLVSLAVLLFLVPASQQEKA